MADCMCLLVDQVDGDVIMADRRKILSNLCILRTWAKINPDYGMGLSVEDCRKAVTWLDDAIDLLKQQDPAAPVKIKMRGSAGDGAWYWACGKCKKDIRYGAGYCEWCGKAVTWNAD